MYNHYKRNYIGYTKTCQGIKKQSNECSIEEKVLLLHVTSGNALMVQVNSGVITGVTVVKGRAGSTLSRAEGATTAEAIQRWW